MKERKNAVGLLIHSEIKFRLNYGTTGISFQFRSVQDLSESYIRTFNLVTNTKNPKAKLNQFLPVIIGGKDSKKLRADAGALSAEITNSDHKFFNLSLENSGRVDRYGRTIWNIEGISLAVNLEEVAGIFEKEEKERITA